ncbi:LytTR family DNA-binding domain-containing protein [Flavobacteriaceae bacterium GF1]
MIIDCIIIEDEPLAMERTKGYVHKIPYLNLIGEFNNGLDALAFLKSNQVDLILLDIEMDDLTGIELLKTLENQLKVIITTAYENYALQGYELDIADYLLKPFGFERFLKAIEKIANHFHNKEINEKDYLFVKTEYRMEKISFTDILFIEGMGDYRNIQTPRKKILTLQTFGELEKYLPKDRFIRVHKSYLVSIDKIEFVERSRIKIGDKRIPISDTYKDGFFQRIGFSNGK